MSEPLLKEFDFIHFNNSGGRYFSHNSIGPFRKTIDGVYCCQSYIVNSGVRDAYLEGLKKNNPIDSVTKELHKKRKNSYIVEPSPVSHVKNKYSYIRDKVVNY